jgi:thymidylate synthase (FAD)
MKKEVLDHGFITLIETWGSDERIIEAARMSTQKGFEGWGPIDLGPCPDCLAAGGPRNPGSSHGYGGQSTDWCADGRRLRKGDEKLLAFLWKNNHATPFEMAGATFEVQAPIFVFREWHRHRVPFSYNEASARYAPLPDLNYVPTIKRLMANAGANKQAQGTGAVLTEALADEFQHYAENTYAELEKLYNFALKNGVPKELARIILPVGRYSKMRASANLRGWLNFLTLRQAPNAQFEIRAYADALHDMLAEKFPRTLALFDEGKAK